MSTLKELVSKNFRKGYISFTEIYDGVVADLGTTLPPQEVRNVFEAEVVPEMGVYYDQEFRTYKRKEN
ncbi:MAG: hypothetical protein Q7S06_02765 [Nanoarchaeota archaeon]|nr:hypothetical protein [Nanoarchaeota archaeon]